MYRALHAQPPIAFQINAYGDNYKDTNKINDDIEVSNSDTNAHPKHDIVCINKYNVSRLPKIPGTLRKQCIVDVL